MDSRGLFRRSVAVACLACLAYAGGTAGARQGAAIGTDALAPPRPGSRLLATAFAPRELAGMTAAETSLAARELAAAARESTGAREELARAFPTAQAVIAFLALDRDIDDFVEASEYPGKTGAYYAESARLAASLRPLRPSYEILYQAAYEALANPLAMAISDKALARTGPRLAAGGKLKTVDRAELPHSHPFALDVFFSGSSFRGEAEYGPPILSLSNGIVVAAAADWRGGAGPAAWKGGGLSPSSGNGVVVYDPSARRYYSYFHMSECEVLPGQIVEAGERLGRGGNSGMNARKKGHGGHVHLEIYDARAARALDAHELIRFLGL